MAKKFTLGSNERLKSRKQIEQLFKEGKAFNVFPFRVCYTLFTIDDSRMTTHDSSFTIHPPIAIGTLFTINFGAAVSTRNFKKAVDRNRIKRVTKEAWRLQKNMLQDVLSKEKKQLNIFFIYTAKEQPEYNLVYEKTGAIINKLVKIIHEKNSLGT